jgi:subtilisin family serine protease
MKYLGNCLFLAALFVGSVCGEQRLIVRSLGQAPLLNSICSSLGCSVIRGLDDPDAQLFLVGIPDAANTGFFIATLSAITGILGVEMDSLLRLSDERPAIPSPLYDTSPVSYYGATVHEGYVQQPAVSIVRLADAQSRFHVSGTGTVAVIDTGVDPNHPVLNPVLLQGYDFTRNQGGGSEQGDLSQSTAAVVDGVPPTYVSDTGAAIVDQSTAAVVDDGHHPDFGHGTMVSGVIHLVAPSAQILPLKAFNADGTGYTSDILRAVYFAARANVQIINMSFSTPQSSQEFKRSVDYAANAGIICVAAAGNQGQSTVVYPAGYSNVMGVASTNNNDQRSGFSNYGSAQVWVAAPGEGVVTTYPFGTYAAAWGTSFSAPFVSGTVSLLIQANSRLTPSDAASAIGHATPLTPDLGHGRLDIFQALAAIRNR